MKMYVCLSCFQAKQGDHHRIDANVCETCSPSFVDNKDATLLPDVVSLCVMADSDEQENPSAIC
jgi:hypothetical protein